MTTGWQDHVTQGQWQLYTNPSTKNNNRSCHNVSVVWHLLLQQQNRHDIFITKKNRKQHCSFRCSTVQWQLNAEQSIKEQLLLIKILYMFHRCKHDNWTWRKERRNNSGYHDISGVSHLHFIHTVNKTVEHEGKEKNSQCYDPSSI